MIYLILTLKTEFMKCLFRVTLCNSFRINNLQGFLLREK